MGVSLHEDLLNQLSFFDLPNDLSLLTKKIISDIDERGFLPTKVDALALENRTSISLTQAAMDVVKMLEPSGVGCFDLQDRLLTQLAQAGNKKSTAYKVLDLHFDDLDANRLPHICAEMKISMALLIEAIDEIKGLRPVIVQAHTSEAEYVSEDVEVLICGDEITFSVLQQRMPKVSINSKYQKMLKDETLSRNDRKFIKEKLDRAVELMQQLANRKTTMELVMGEIIKIQRSYFYQGNEALVPLTMKQVADVIECHETTISRTVANKYLRSPLGLVPLKMFFSSGSSLKSSHLDTTGVAVKSKIKTIIDAEDRNKPLSDAKIAVLLKNEGITIARRTVAKYREGLGIQATSLRRQYGNS